MCADWSQLFQDPVNIIHQPDPLADSFIAAVKPSGCVLDVGCGGGRHLVHLARAGFKVFGGDTALSGLQSSRDWLNQEGLHADLCLMEIAQLPFANGVFDGAISINVLQHTTLIRTAQTVEDIRRILKPDSPFFFVVIGRDDARYGEGDEIEPYTFIHRQGIEAGVPHHYYSRAEIERLVQNFNRTLIEIRRRPYDDSHPIFGSDPRLKDRKDAVLQHWAVQAWV